MKFNLYIGLLLVAVVSVVFFIAYQFVPPPPPKNIKIATGREGGAYHNFALQYQQKLKEKFDIELEIVPTAGSVDAMIALSKGEVDFAFVQGGVAKNMSDIGDSEIVSVASLFYEPLWVFHQTSVPTRYLSDLRGKRIAIGEVGSGTRPLAYHRLKDNNVTEENSTFFEIPSAEAIKRLKNGELDAAFFVSSPNTDWIKELIAAPNLELMHFKRYAAYTKRYHHMNHIEITEGGIHLAKNLPRKDTILLSVTAALLTHKTTHDGLIRLLLHILQPIHEKGDLIEPANLFPTNQFLELPLHHTAAHYLKYGPSWLEKFLPFGIAVQLERLSILLIPLLTLLIPLFKGAFPIYRWSIRFKIYRWYEDLRKIDREMDTFELSVIDDEIKRLSNLRLDLAKQVSVPLSYMSEFYTLRVHVNLVLQQLKERQQKILNHEKQSE